MFSQSPFKNRQIVPKVSCVVHAYIYIYISFYMGKEKRARLPYLLARGDLPYGTALSAITYRSRGGGGGKGWGGNQRTREGHVRAHTTYLRTLSFAQTQDSRHGVWMHREGRP